MKFKPFDFQDPNCRLNESIWIEQAVERANDKLKAHLATLPILYSVDLGPWHNVRIPDDTHQGILWGIAEIESECNNHEPPPDNITFDENNYEHLSSCKHCGVKLKAKWSKA